MDYYIYAHTTVQIQMNGKDALYKWSMFWEPSLIESDYWTLNLSYLQSHSFLDIIWMPCYIRKFRFCYSLSHIHCGLSDIHSLQSLKFNRTLCMTWRRSSLLSSVNKKDKRYWEQLLLFCEVTFFVSCGAKRKPAIYTPTESIH